MRLKNPNITKIIIVSFFIFQSMTAGMQMILGPAHFSDILSNTSQEKNKSPIKEEAISSRLSKNPYQEPENIANLNFEEYKNKINKIEREILNYKKVLLELIHEIKQLDDEINEIIKEKNRIVCIKFNNMLNLNLNFNGILDCIYLIVNDDEALDSQIKQMRKEQVVLLTKKECYKDNIIQSQKNKNELNSLFPIFSQKLRVAFAFDPDIRELSALTSEDILLLVKEGIDFDL